MPDDDWRKRNPNYQEPLLSHNMCLVRRLRDIGIRHGCSAGEVAVAWVLRNPAVTGAIVGLRRPGQIKGLLARRGLSCATRILPRSTNSWRRRLPEPGKNAIIARVAFPSRPAHRHPAA